MFQRKTMFKKADISAEIASSMESQLVSNALDKRAEQMNKFAKALDCLNVAAEIFDDLGLRKEAEATTSFLEVLAGKKKKKKPVSSKKKSKVKSKSRKDPATKGLTSKKMVNNLEHKGWVFNADDFNFSDEDINLMQNEHHDECMCSMCMDADDDNYHYDSDSDASYHVDRNDVDEFDLDPDNSYLEPDYEDGEDEYFESPNRRHDLDDPYGPGGVSDRYEGFDHFEDESDVEDEDDWDDPFSYAHRPRPMTVIPPPGSMKNMPQLPPPKRERDRIGDIVQGLDRLMELGPVTTNVEMYSAPESLKKEHKEKRKEVKTFRPPRRR